MMAVYRVTAPDGSEHEVTAPESATERQVLDYVRQNYTKSRTEQKQPAQEKPSALVNVGRGMMDVAQGLKQLYLMATGKPGEAEEYTKRVNDEISLYEKGRGSDAGIDWGRIGGNFAGSLPTMLIPGGASAQLGARVAAGAAGGAATGGAMFSPDPTVGNKVLQAAAGGALGGLAPVATAGALKAAGKVVNVGARKTTEAVNAAKHSMTPAQINMQLKVELKGQGIDFDQLGDAVRDSLTKDAQKSLRATGKLDAAALARKADILGIGAKPLKGQITQDPTQWAFERNTADIVGAGDDIKARLMDQNAQLKQAAENIARKTGGTAADDYAAAESMIKSLKSADSAERAKITAAYDAFKRAGGGQIDVPMQPIAQTVGNIMEEAPDLIPGGVKSKLMKYGVLDPTQSKAFSLDDAESLLKTINRYYDPANKAQARVLNELRSSVEDAKGMLSARGDIAGTEAAQLAQAAREAAASRFSAIKASPALKAITNPVETDPQGFFTKHVLHATPKQLTATLKALDDKTKQDVRGALVQWLASEATNNYSAQFSGGALNKAIERVGQRRLAAVFREDPQALAALLQLNRAAKAMTVTPAFARSGVGSNTAEKMLNYLSRVPYWRQIIDKPFREFAQNVQVQSALSGAPAVAQVPPVISREMMEEIARRAGRLSGPSAAATYGALNQ